MKVDLSSPTPTWAAAPDHFHAVKNDWHVVARSADVPESSVLAVRLLGENIVLWRVMGKVHAWRDYCLHRGAKLSLGYVQNGNIVCPYHGWCYNERAECVLIPAHPTQKPPLKAQGFEYHCEERFGLIWVCTGREPTALPPFPEWENEAFRKVHAGPYPYKANAMRTIENFLDTAHFPYVHRGLNGDPANPDPIEDYEVYEDETGLRTSEITVNQPYGDHRGIPVVAGYTFHCPRLLTAYFSKKTGPTERFCTFMTVTPVEPDACIVWLVVAINYGPELTIEQILTRQDRVFTQDRIIVESQWPVVMPLSLTEELHVRCDRLAIQYRKWARRLADENRGIPTIPVHAAALGD